MDDDGVPWIFRCVPFGFTASSPRRIISLCSPQEPPKVSFSAFDSIGEFPSSPNSFADPRS